MRAPSRKICWLRRLAAGPCPMAPPGEEGAPAGGLSLFCGPAWGGLRASRRGGGRSECIVV